MSKDFLVFLLLFLSSFISFSQIPVHTRADSLGTIGYGPNSREVIRRNNIVKTIVSRSDLKDGKTSGYRFIKAYYYDTEGRLIKEQYLSIEGGPGLTDTFVYNREGKWISSKGVNYAGKVYYSCTLNGDIGITKWLNNKDSMRTDTAMYSYNKDKRLTKFSSIGKEGNFSNYYYDDYGRIERIDHLKYDGRKDHTEIFQYKRRKNYGELIIYIERLEERYKAVQCRFNNQNRCVSCSRNFYQRRLGSREFKYNNDGTLGEHLEYYGEKDKNRVLFKYDYLYR